MRYNFTRHMYSYFIYFYKMLLFVFAVVKINSCQIPCAIFIFFHNAIFRILKKYKPCNISISCYSQCYLMDGLVLHINYYIHLRFMFGLETHLENLPCPNPSGSTQVLQVNKRIGGWGGGRDKLYTPSPSPSANPSGSTYVLQVNKGIRGQMGGGHMYYTPPPL